MHGFKVSPLLNLVSHPNFGRAAKMSALQGRLIMLVPLQGPISDMALLPPQPPYESLGTLTTPPRSLNTTLSPHYLANTCHLSRPSQIVT